MALDHITDIHPLTPVQTGVLFHALQGGDSAAYFEQVQVDVRGDLDPDRLQHAVDDLLVRHAALRSHLLWERVPVPVQVVRDDVRVAVDVRDHRPAPLTDDDLGAIADGLRAQPFDLRRPPLVRITLVRQSADHARLIWDSHHVLLDGWSTPMLLGELFERYDALADPDAAPIDVAPAFREYAAWIAEHDLEADNRYWIERVKDAPPVRLPTTPAVTTAERRRHDLIIDPATTTRLAQRARELRITLGTAVFGAWSMVLADLNGTHDLSFATANAGRPPSIDGVEDIAGLFISNVPVVAHLDAEAPLNDQLQQLHLDQTDSLDHPTVDLGVLRRELDGSTIDGVYDHVLVVQNFVEREQTGTLRWDIVDSYDESRYAMDLFVTPGESVELTAMYDPERLNESSVAVLLDRLAYALTAIADDPAQPLQAVWDGFAAGPDAADPRPIADGLRACGFGGVTVIPDDLSVLSETLVVGAGGDAQIIPAAAMADPERLVRALALTDAAWAVTSGPALDATVTRFGDLGRRLPDLRGWIVVDPVTVESAAALHEQLPDVRLVALLQAGDGPPIAMASPPGEFVDGHPTPAFAARPDRVLRAQTGDDGVGRILLADGTVLRTRPHEIAQHAAPEGSMEEGLDTVLDAWRVTLDDPAIGPDDDFFDVGGTSLTAISVLAQIRDRLDANIPLRAFVTARTPRQLARLIHEGIGSDLTRSLHLVPLADGRDDLVPVVLIHGAGGNVVSFSKVAERLEDPPPLYGLEAAGVDGIQPPHTDFEQLLDDYIDELLTLAPDGDLIIGGYSAGGTIGVHVAARLAEMGTPPRSLVLIDTFHPSIRFDPADDPWAKRLRNLTKNLRMRVKKRFRQRREAAELAVATEIAEREWGLIPAEVREGHIGAALDAVIATDGLPSYDGPATLLWTTQRFVDRTTPEDRGWDDLLPKLEYSSTNGHHRTLFDDEWIDETSAGLAPLLSIER